MNSDTVRIGDVTFAQETRSLTFKDGSTVQLRHKSKEVLRCLVEHAGRTVSKSEIMDRVWPDVTVSDESLVQCIADIRRVIGDNARDIVETIPREGYRLNLEAQAPVMAKLPILPALAASLAIGLLWVFWPAPPAEPEEPTQPIAADLKPSPPGTDVTEAYLEVLQGSISAGRFNPDESLIAERHFRRAIALDPNYARAYAELGTLFAVRFENDWTVLREADRDKALFYAERAVSLDPDLGAAHYALGRLQSVLSNLDAAEAHLQRAMALQPDNEDARAYYGIVRNFRGDAEGAIAILRPALASHPKPPTWYYLGLGSAELNAGNYQRAADALNTCLDLAENSPYCLRYLIATYAMMGRLEEAEATKGAYAALGLELSLAAIMGPMAVHTPEDQAFLEKAYRSAGLSE
ncbi:MAG: winged helix-turn-helix domain-containing protein [Pseudomonadota bacterium]